MPTAALPEPACDGQLWPGETANRSLPCFADTTESSCRLQLRQCTDQAGVAYATECEPTAASLTLTSTALCDRYLGCQQNACEDVIGCFTKNATVRNCTLRIATPTAPGPLTPCADGVWETTLASSNTGAADACVGAIVEGGVQSLFELGFVGSGSAVNGSCPLTLRIDHIVPTNIDLVPYTTDVFITQGDQVVDLHIAIAVGCAAVSTTTSSFSCP